MDKLETVRNLQEPHSKSEVQSLVGFLSQLNGFVPEINFFCPNIKKLTSKFNNFLWQDIHKQEFQLIKQKLENVIPLTPINTTAPLILHTDASTDSLGWILSQLRSQEEDQDVYTSPHNIVAMVDSNTWDILLKYFSLGMNFCSIGYKNIENTIFFNIK